MARLLVTAVVSAALAAPAAAAPDRAAKFPVNRARTPVSLLRLQEDLFEAKRWKDLWQAYSPRFRARCDFEIWRGHLVREWPAIHDHATTNVRARITGNKARVTYTIKDGASVVFRVTSSSPDVYVKIRGRWYDEVDPHTQC